MGEIMPPGWVNLLIAGVDHPLPASVTLCPEHARVVRAQLKDPQEELGQMPIGGSA
jgi:hypothetical protein